MTDLETLKKMFERSGVEYTEEHLEKGEIGLIVERGYTGFYTGYSFDSEGRLLDVGAYE